MNVGVNLAHYKPINSWDPEIGDIVVWHGWIQHWFGIVAGVNPSEDKIYIVKSGLPLLLVGMSPPEIENNKTELSLSSILSSTGGKYAALQTVNNTLVWYV